MTDASLDRSDVIDAAIRASGARDGDEITVAVTKTGRRPFGDRRVVYTRPHTYEREPAASPAPVMDAAPSGVGDGGTARTCETCGHKKPLGVNVRQFADVGFSGVCDPDGTGGSGLARDNDACTWTPPRWTPRGSNTEGGEG